MTKIIEKTVVSKYAPHDTNVDWLDVSGDKPIKKSYINGEWQAISGDCSTNPEYNVTKQTVTLFDDTIETEEVIGGMYRGMVENIDFDLVAGETYTVVFDGISYDIKAATSPFDSQNVFLGEMNDGRPSFETYPFGIMLGTDELVVKGLALVTNIEGSHAVEIKHEEGTVTTTPEFKDAVDSVTGYSIDKGCETLFDGTVETVDSEGYTSGIITPTITFVEGNTYKVAFNGTEYTCKCFNDYGNLSIGATFNEETPDWSTYPFNIATYNAGGGQNETGLVTNQEGSYTLKIEHLSVSTKTTPAFESMIQSITASSGIQIPLEANSNFVSYSEIKAGNTYLAYYMAYEDGQIYYYVPVIILDFEESGNNMTGHAISTGLLMHRESISSDWNVLKPINANINDTTAYSENILSIVKDPLSGEYKLEITPIVG